MCGVQWALLTWPLLWGACVSPPSCSAPPAEFSFFRFYSSYRFVYLPKFFFRESLLCLISLLDNFPVFYLYPTYFGVILIVWILSEAIIVYLRFFLQFTYLLKKILHGSQECPFLHSCQFSCLSFSRDETVRDSHHTWVLIFSCQP